MKIARLVALSIIAMLLVFVAIWWQRSPSHARSEPSRSNEVSKATPIEQKRSGSLSPNVLKRVQNGNLTGYAQASAEQERRLAEIGITPGMTREQMQEHVALLDRTQREAFAENWRKPIEFYGKVINQSNQPIADVHVHFVRTDASASGTSESDTLTDGQGQFALQNAKGRMLQVWLNKNGYYVPKNNPNNFDFASGFIADPSNPVLFHLVKKGEGANLVTSHHGVSSTLDFSVSTHDGSPIRVDFFNQKVGRDGQMEISQSKPAYGTWQTATSWSYRLVIPDGGFAETCEEFPFEAPASGYQPVVEFNFQKANTNWTERIDKTFYIAFGIPRKYGRIHIETTMTTGTILDYAINPDGSRNLEPK